MHKNIMIQGTASNVGKSIIATALCKIFAEDGYSVAPFKSQNMALNSYVTLDGFEMGRAQAVQAEACGILPEVYMNPVLLKPSADTGTQVIVEGIVRSDMEARYYFRYRKNLKEIIAKNYSILKEKFDIGVIEGAGSCAEINLNTDDIVNMGVAEMADSPVILVADIDRGGVFASVYGTIELLPENERNRIKGVIINKFRGNIDIFRPGIRMLESLIKRPVLGVIPYTEVHIEDEDSVTERLQYDSFEDNKINISIIRLPHMSNFTDFDAFKVYKDVLINYAKTPDEISNPDILIIPGSKNTIRDLIKLKEAGFEKVIRRINSKGKIIIGICGGYQMLGTKITDPFSVESSISETEGFNLLNVKTIMSRNKTLSNSKSIIDTANEIFQKNNMKAISGYEIHMGDTEVNEKILMRTGSRVTGVYKENVFGTYLHGVFDNKEFTDLLLNYIRKQKGIKSYNTEISYNRFKKNELKKLSNFVRRNLDINKVYEIMGIKRDKTDSSPALC